MYTFYYYEHCPYCVRVLAFLNMMKIDFQPIVLASDDEATPIKMIGKKMLPILEVAPQQYLSESLDIIDFLAEQSQFSLEKNKALELHVDEFLAEIREVNYGLTMPRWVDYSFKEFATQSAKDYFIRKKTQTIGDFEDALQQTEVLKKDLAESMKKYDELFKKLALHNESRAAIILFSALYGLRCVECFEWPSAVKKFMQILSKQTRLVMEV